MIDSSILKRIIIYDRALSDEELVTIERNLWVKGYSLESWMIWLIVLALVTVALTVFIWWWNKAWPAPGIDETWPD